MDKWYSDSIEVAHVKIVGTSLENDPERDKERVRIKYQVIEQFKGDDSETGHVYEGLHNCALGVRTGAKYILFIREHRLISRCGGSQMISDWIDKGKIILEQLRDKELNKGQQRTAKPVT
ncbi:hypothetical protein ACJJI3_10040 [Microbulbifer sp. ZKSA004]|uniref:hypothetical protein n=1 Tax=Microbulbifer sp. ZKSA004 TaxID=3243389 RepID=UPI004039E6A5